MRSPFILAALVVAATFAAGAAEDESPAEFREISIAFEREVAAVQSETAEKLSQARLETVRQLQAVQDRLCREAKLDEAVAVRDRIRELAGEMSPVPPPGLTPEAQEIAAAFEVRSATIQREAVERIEDVGTRAAKPLRQLMDRFCRDGQLDEAVAARDLLKRVTGVITDVRPDPGYLRANAVQIGQVLYFDVVGSTPGSLYGTGVYTSDSSLAAAAVHSGVLKNGERGIVQVTVLPGQLSYEASTRRGITSSSYGRWSCSFKVERAYGIATKW